MLWTPKYTISNTLLSTVREIGESLGELKSLHLSDQDLAKLEIEARELSSYASTGIEGNPLPLTDVKRLLKTRKEHVRDTEREVLNYNNALQSLYADVRSGKFKLDFDKLVKLGLIETKGTGRGTYYVAVS
jgi:Fic family protein